MKFVDKTMLVRITLQGMACDSLLRFAGLSKGGLAHATAAAAAATSFRGLHSANFLSVGAGGGNAGGGASARKKARKSGGPQWVKGRGSPKPNNGRCSRSGTRNDDGGGGGGGGGAGAGAGAGGSSGAGVKSRSRSSSSARQGATAGPALVPVTGWLSFNDVCSVPEAKRYLRAGHVEVDGAVTKLNIKVPPSARVRLLPSAVAMEDAKLCIAQYKPYSFYSQSTKAPRRGEGGECFTKASFASLLDAATQQR